MTSNKRTSGATPRLRLAMPVAIAIAMLATGLGSSLADAQARPAGGNVARAAGGGGGAARGGNGGRSAQASVSGVNHAGRPNAGGGDRGNGARDGDRRGGGNNNQGNRTNNGNINVGNDINIDIDQGYGYGHGGYYHHPIATGMAIGAVAVTTAAILGASYYSLPPGCTTVYRNGVSYYYCGSTYYQQSWSGNDVVYIVVNP
jgi:hypothetical protein